jgi:hypothetical protein
VVLSILENKNNFFRYVAIFLNILYILWLLYNGIDEGFKGNIITIMAPLGLILLLILNIVLLKQNKVKIKLKR